MESIPVSSSSEIAKEGTNNETPVSCEFDDVIILPTPPKPKPLLITIDDEETPTSSGSNSGGTRSERNVVKVAQKESGSKQIANARKKKKGNANNNAVIESNQKSKKKSRHARKKAARLRELGRRAASTENVQLSSSLQPFEQNSFRNNRYLLPTPNNWSAPNYQNHFHSNYGTHEFSQNVMQYPPHSVMNTALNRPLMFMPRFNNLLTNENFGVGQQFNSSFSYNDVWLRQSDQYSTNSRYERFYGSNYSSQNYGSNNPINNSIQYQCAYTNNSDDAVNLNLETSEQHQPNLTPPADADISTSKNSKGTGSDCNLNQSSASVVNNNENANTFELSPAPQSTNVCSGINQSSSSTVNSCEDRNVSQLSAEISNNLVSGVNQSSVSIVNTDKDANISQLSSQLITNLASGEVNQSSVCINTDKSASSRLSPQHTSSSSNINLSSESVNTDKSKITSEISSQLDSTSSSDLNQSSKSAVNTNKSASTSRHHIRSSSDLNQPSETFNTDKNASIHELSSQHTDLPSDLNKSSSVVNTDKSSCASQLSIQHHIGPFSELNKSSLSDVNSYKNANASQLSSNDHIRPSSNINLPSASAYTDKSSITSQLSSQCHTRSSDLNCSSSSSVNKSASTSDLFSHQYSEPSSDFEPSSVSVNTFKSASSSQLSSELHIRPSSDLNLSSASDVNSHKNASTLKSPLQCHIQPSSDLNRSTSANSDEIAKISQLFSSHQNSRPSSNVTLPPTSIVNSEKDNVNTSQLLASQFSNKTNSKVVEKEKDQYISLNSSCDFNPVKPVNPVNAQNGNHSDVASKTQESEKDTNNLFVIDNQPSSSHTMKRKVYFSLTASKSAEKQNSQLKSDSFQPNKNIFNEITSKDINVTNQCVTASSISTSLSSGMHVVVEQNNNQILSVQKAKTASSNGNFIQELNKNTLSHNSTSSKRAIITTVRSSEKSRVTNNKHSLRVNSTASMQREIPIKNNKNTLSHSGTSSKRAIITTVRSSEGNISVSSRKSPEARNNKCSVSINPTTSKQKEGLRSSNNKNTLSHKDTSSKKAIITTVKSSETGIPISNQKSSETRNNKHSRDVNTITSAKRKIPSNDNNRAKKQKYCDTRSTKPSDDNKVTKQRGLNNDTSTSSFINSSSKATKSISSVTLPVVDKAAPSNGNACSTSVNFKRRKTRFDSEIPTETLNQQVACGNAPLRKELHNHAINVIENIGIHRLNSSSNVVFLAKSSKASSCEPLKSNITCSKGGDSVTNSAINAIRTFLDSNQLNTNAKVMYLNKANGTTNNVTNSEDMSCVNNPTKNVIINDIALNSSSNLKTVDDTIAVSKTQSSSLPLPNSSSLDSAKDQTLSQSYCKKDSDTTNVVSETEPTLPSHLNLLIDEHRRLAFKEEIVNQNLLKAKSQRDEHIALLKKLEEFEIKLHKENDDVKKQKNVVEKIIKTVMLRNGIGLQTSHTLPEVLSDADLTVKSAIQNEEKECNSTVSFSTSPKPVSPPEISYIQQNKTPLSAESDQISVLSSGESGPCAINPQLTSQPSSVKSKLSAITTSDNAKENMTVIQDCCNNFKDLQSANMPEVSHEQKCHETAVSLKECNEILILPISTKPDPPLITIDDAEEKAAGSQESNAIHESEGKPTTEIPKKGPSVFDGKKFPAHSGLINSVVVFEDHLYTCSNDHTAKRFSLQDVCQTVTYQHAAKNVREIVVEKIQNEAIVCTSDSNNGISMFQASSGKRITSFTHYCTVSNICKGWGKVYSGWTDGSIHIYSWTRDLGSPMIRIVKTKTPISCIATTHEGHLPFLIILSTDSKIYLRGAESGTFIRCIEAKVTIPPCLTIHKNLAHFRCTEDTISVFNFVTRKVEKKLCVNQFVTGIAANENYVFTIVANGGWVNCYQVDGTKPGANKLFYGAGKRNLSCVYLYQNWVFTGNCRGNVFAFRFDPDVSEICKYHSCRSVFCSKDDLEFHVKNDHLPQEKNIKCQWIKCNFKFQRTDNLKAKLRHFKTHIY